MSEREDKRYYCTKCNKEPSKTIGGRFRIVQTDDWNFKVLENRATIERRKTLGDRIQQFLPVIALALITVLFIVVTYFSYNYMREIAGACGSVARAAPTPPIEAPSGPAGLLKLGSS